MSGRITEFQERGCEVLGISTDDIDTHVRWLTTSPADGGLGRIAFPLAADPDGAVCQQYRVYLERQRVGLRGVFMIDPNGVLQYQVVHSLSVGRSTDELLRVLDALQSGGLCPGEREAGGAIVDVMSNLQPGRVLGDYQIEAELGSGSFGTVFRARDVLLDRSVALKILRSDSDKGVDNLLNEARAAAALSHPNVCAVHTIDTTNGVAMIVMEYVRGRPLSEIIGDGRLSKEETVKLVRQIAAGMSIAHGAGVVHGDLKPGNIVVNEGGEAKIMDFGLSRRTETTNLEEDTLPQGSGSTSSGLTGTLGYLAPELARGGSSTNESDVFALGLIFYEMLSGKRAITGNNIFDALENIESFDAASIVSEVPKEFQTVLGSMLSRDPEKRMTMSEAVKALGG